MAGRLAHLRQEPADANLAAIEQAVKELKMPIQCRSQDHSDILQK